MDGAHRKIEYFKSLFVTVYKASIVKPRYNTQIKELILMYPLCDRVRFKSYRFIIPLNLSTRALNFLSKVYNIKIYNKGDTTTLIIKLHTIDRL